MICTQLTVEFCISSAPCKKEAVIVTVRTRKRPPNWFLQALKPARPTKVRLRPWSSNFSQVWHGLLRRPDHRRSSVQAPLCQSDGSSFRDNHVHDVIITNEAPNYQLDE